MLVAVILGEVDEEKGSFLLKKKHEKYKQERIFIQIFLSNEKVLFRKKTQ